MTKCVNDRVVASRALSGKTRAKEKIQNEKLTLISQEKVKNSFHLNLIVFPDFRAMVAATCQT